jgi:hypothetical protein
LCPVRSAQLIVSSSFNHGCALFVAIFATLFSTLFVVARYFLLHDRIAEAASRAPIGVDAAINITRWALA